MTRNSRIALLALLIKIANSDKELRIEEQNFIKKIQEKNSDIDLETITNYIIPQSEHERMIILYNLLFLATVDGIIDSHESEFLDKVVIELGFRPEMKNQMLNVLEKYKNESSLPSDALLNVIKAYLN